MMSPVPPKPPLSAVLPLPAFVLESFLDSAGIGRTIRKYARSAVIFSQGDAATDVFYMQQGSVKLSVLSRTGKEAVVAVLGPGDFFGEGCLAAQPRRIATASAMSASTSARDREASNARDAAHAAGACRTFPRAHAGAEHPGGGGPRRSALQLERKAPGARSTPAGALREAGPAAPDPEAVAGDARRRWSARRARASTSS